MRQITGDVISRETRSAISITTRTASLFTRYRRCFSVESSRRQSPISRRHSGRWVIVFVAENRRLISHWLICKNVAMIVIRVALSRRNRCEVKVVCWRLKLNQVWQVYFLEDQMNLTSRWLGVRFFSKHTFVLISTRIPFIYLNI